MKTVNALVLSLMLASVLAAGCISPSASPTPAQTATPTTMPALTATPGPSALPMSPVYMVNQTTNGRTYPPPSITAIANGSRPGGQMTGELGRQ